MSEFGKRGEVLLPTLHYFREKNKYSGSKDTTFRYKITPADEMECVVWYGLNAIDCISDEDIRASESFPLSDEGMLSMKSWLEEQYVEYIRCKQRSVLGH